ANLRDLAAFKDVMRAFINKAFFEPASYLSSLFDKLSTQFSVSTKNLNRYLQKDILALYDGAYVADDELSARTHAFVTFTYEDRPFTLSGTDCLEIIRDFEDIIIPDQNLLKGQTANGKSIIQGKVKVIPVDYSDFNRVNAEIEKMEPGDILVAETTAPELMLACKKAAAIVTDLGGLLSHAAIVSRELGIPCIVNTKHASRVLKDGDIVEIDTTRGVVRRIELIKNTLK
ncbi:MAG TPA: PEP-utilizing enzyme, partial [Patescibacteria group bacterium]